MHCDVFDTYVAKPDGQMMHFDIIVPSGTTQEKVLAFGQSYLTAVGISSDLITAERCRYCHVERATAEMAVAIKHQGYYILAMEGCPPVAPQTKTEVVNE